MERLCGQTRSLRERRQALRVCRLRHDHVYRVRPGECGKVEGGFAPASERSHAPSDRYDVFAERFLRVARELLLRPEPDLPHEHRIVPGSAFRLVPGVLLLRRPRMVFERGRELRVVVSAEMHSHYPLGDAGALELREHGSDLVLYRGPPSFGRIGRPRPYGAVLLHLAARTVLRERAPLVAEHDGSVFPAPHFVHVSVHESWRRGTSDRKYCARTVRCAQSVFHVCRKSLQIEMPVSPIAFVFREGRQIDGDYGKLDSSAVQSLSGIRKQLPSRSERTLLLVHDRRGNLTIHGQPACSVDRHNLGRMIDVGCQRPVEDILRLHVRRAVLCRHGFPVLFPCGLRGLQILRCPAAPFAFGRRTGDDDKRGHLAASRPRMAVLAVRHARS